MKRNIKYAKLLLVLALCLSLWVNAIAMAGQKSIGAYTTDSQSTTANTLHQPSGATNRLLPAPAIMRYARLVGETYAAGYVIGRVARIVADVYGADNYSQLAIAGYEPLDFSSFD